MIVDTNIIIDLLNGKKEAFKFLDSNLRNNLLLSVVSVSEIYAGIRGEKEVQLLEDLLTIFELIPVNKSIAVEAGFLRTKPPCTESTGVWLGTESPGLSTTPVILRTLPKDLAFCGALLANFIKTISSGSKIRF